jgi:hypothetical protein
MKTRQPFCHKKFDICCALFFTLWAEIATGLSIPQFIFRNADDIQN